MMNFNRFDVAARLRGLLAGQDMGVVGGSANRLGVTELALRISIDETDPHPTFEVLMAVVRDYGVDPTWLVSGEYDPVKHRQALEDDAAIARVLSQGVTGPRLVPSPVTPQQQELSIGAPLQPDQDSVAAVQPQSKVVAHRDTRTRVIDADGLTWKVREEPWPTIDRRGGTSLIFEADTVVRRVRNFPPDWYSRSDSDLYSLSLGP